MVQSPIRYDDGAAYERMMGAWSWIAGEIFLDWLMPEPGLRWIDIGCGSGAFTGCGHDKNIDIERGSRRHFPRTHEDLRRMSAGNENSDRER